MKKTLSSAPPQWHSVALVVGFGTFFLATFPSLEVLDEAATMEAFTKILFPKVLDLRTMAIIRLMIALFVWVVTFEMVFLSKGWLSETPYLKTSRLKMVPNRMIGIKTAFPFTSVSWNLLGLSFTLSSYIAFQGAKDETVSPWILRIALCSWEVAAPNSLLVAAVIKYSIWPKILAKGNSTATLKMLRSLLMHNINVFFTVMESAFLGGLPVRWSELSLAPLVGIAYVIFSWCMTMSWNKPEHGPQFIYFFFDTTVPGYFASVALVALLAALILFFVIFCSCEHLLAWADAGVAGSLAFVVVICSGMMRFTD